MSRPLGFCPPAGEAARPRPSPAGRAQAFRARVRLRARSDFEAMREGVGRISRGNVLALWRQSPTGRTRLGITASTKVGNAVIRNRAKRWTREWFRKSKSNLPIGVDLIIIVRRGAVSSGHPAFDRDLGAVERTLCRAALAPAASGGPSA